jgi:hypothetical protein
MSMEDYYAGKGSQAGYAGEAVKMSPFDRLSGSVDSLREMQKMARAIADRLTGPQPPQPASAGSLKEVAGGGLIDGIERQASFIQEIHADIYASLSRIENRL